ncbi:hypothetical protein SAMN05443252_102325 [Bacillus sp. OV322]|nr:hypothetical protein SAMN05443252_102325 [Bacillus sp. OV322]
MSLKLGGRSGLLEFARMEVDLALFRRKLARMRPNRALLSIKMEIMRVSEPLKLGGRSGLLGIRSNGG